jgi:hypothetical protein
MVVKCTLRSGDKTTHIGPRIAEIDEILPSLCQRRIRIQLRANDKYGYRHSKLNRNGYCYYSRFLSPGSWYSIQTGVSWSTKCTSKVPSAHSALGRDPRILSLSWKGLAESALT